MLYFLCGILLALVALAVWACRASEAAEPLDLRAEAHAALAGLRGELRATRYARVHADVLHALARAHAAGVALGCAGGLGGGL